MAGLQSISLSSRTQDLSGMRFGRLVAVKYSGISPIDRRPRWRCKCDCGSVCVKSARNLISGGTRSCGCLYAPYIKHGLARDSVFRIWRGMLRRCSAAETSARTRRLYYDRGIRVADEWSCGLDGFRAFAEHIGPRPSFEHTIDRIDNNGNYEPGNVRWATREQQQNNKRGKVLLEFNGEFKYLYQWADSIGLSRSAFLRRLQRGWTMQEIMTVSKVKSRQGERAGQAKLTDEAVREIRSRTISIREMAAKYGVSQAAICLVLSGKTWRHVS